MAKEIEIREFHQARWNEPIVLELTVPGERGILVAKAEQEVAEAAGDVLGEIAGVRRKKRPALPQVSQPRLVRHYSRVTQEMMGSDNTLGISQGTCTLKYNPKVQEHMMRHPGLMDVHPLQDTDTMQGILEIYYKTEQIMKELAGMERFSFLPVAGGHAIYTNAQLVRKYHESKGNTHKTEIVTTLHSHPVDAAASSTLGYKIITLMPDEKTGLPNFEEYKAALSEKTAAIFITNPEDTGIFNDRIHEFTEAAHQVDAVCVYDQANANALLGVARAGEAGFDLMHFNLHKTFSSPHGSDGPGCGAIGCTGAFEAFLPKPTVEFDGSKYYLDYDRKDSIGYVKLFLGNATAVTRAYMWCMSLGWEGMRQAAVISVLNNQYMTKKILEKVPGVSLHYGKGERRMEQTRLSFDKLFEETGLGIVDVNHRLVDYGISELWMSHHPFTVPEPFTPEPCESYNKDDIDYYVEVLRRIAVECREDPETIRTAPHKCARHRPIDIPADSTEESFGKLATTWRAYVKRFGKS
ncbi:aminomethyl-transferring glycine dehydrogenase subunit GcvPB [Bacilliculturomica massiliensis]|uniref:aminomethyl-transferring glycine dehydrogenase subunit GcvPB n=1 Tax=Bacilliculturomica massiliensis TaxID=1917867 RepID=UPI00102FAD1D|nr:aminomethyl-transferring glycine dehydrogenase subunit GcvPB [Bacilliculturomica massiliensis]